MKRSEMVKLIHKVISTELKTTKEFNISDCSKLLTKLEENGMLPPAYFCNEKTEVYKIPIGPINMWEPEDENDEPES